MNIGTPPFLAHFDPNKVPTITGVVGTLGTSDALGTAKAMPIGVDPATGAAYVYNLGPAGTTTPAGTQDVNIIGGTINTLPSLPMGTNWIGAINIYDSEGHQIDADFVNLAYRLRVVTVGTVNVGTITTGSLTNIATLHNGTITEKGYSYKNFSATGTTVIKATAGELHGFTINQKSVGGLGTLYDGTAITGGTTIAAIDTTLSTTSFTYDALFTSGLVFAWVGNTGGDVTITYR